MISRIVRFVRHLWHFRASHGTVSAIARAARLLKARLLVLPQLTSNRRDDLELQRFQKLPDLKYFPPTELAVGRVAVLGDFGLATKWAIQVGVVDTDLVAVNLDSLSQPDWIVGTRLFLISQTVPANLSGHVRSAMNLAWRAGIPVIGALTDRQAAQLANQDTFAVVHADRSGKEDLAADHFSTVEILRACDFVWANGISFNLLCNHWSFRTQPSGSIAVVVDAFAKRRMPDVTVIGILYRKRSEISVVLETYAAQTYHGNVEFLMVDDCSPDDSSEVTQRTQEQLASNGVWPSRFSLRIIRNAHNSGNCVSRNVAIAQARGRILIIIDADCAINPGFIAAHVAAHAVGDAEVVLGPMNIESNSRPVGDIFQEVEGRPEVAMARASLQDGQNLPAFVNCITRNFSIDKEWLLGQFAQPLFDPLFGYSADPASGFGWEDVEAGYRLYLSGARIKFTVGALSVHVSPVLIHDDASRPRRSLLNFRRLHEKHPELHRVARSWSVETFGNICNWADLAKVNCEPDRAWLNLHLRQEKSPLFSIRKSRPLRVLTYRWHVPHQYELYKLPFDFTLVTGLGTEWTEQWEFEQRPMPRNARFAHLSGVNPEDYDLAILHFDENTLRTDLTQGVIDASWSLPLLHFLDNVHIPKVAVCHGTPQFHGQYTPGYSGTDLMQPIIESRSQLVSRLRGVPVVCNSYQAEAEWGFADSRTIWHGLDAADFPPTTYQRGIVSPLGALVTSRPHYRGYYLYREVFDGHFDALKPDRLRVPRPHPVYEKGSAAYAWAKYRNYVDVLRQYSVYFNPTLRSPMPRARTEPMMCGVVPVSASNHDVEHFIRNGENGFHSSSATELREYLYFLMRHPEACRRMGAAARATALKEFNIDRFVGTWQQLARSVAS